MRRWFIPSWCGDFRLEAVDEKTCKLIVTDPIPTELTQLGQFLVKARKKGWVDNCAGISPQGKSDLVIGAPVAKAGKVLLGRKSPRKGILTVIKSEDGVLTAVTGDGDELQKASAAPTAADAVTVRRPTLCCPYATTGPDLRASQVLQAFCTTEQWRSWLNLGYLYCCGNLSGRKYLVAHRHHPIAINNKYVVWDVTGDHVVHCWDWSIPPPEETLVIKLVLEHAEHWIRNRSGTFGLNIDDQYHNPFMPDNAQWQDGLLSTRLSCSVAKAIRSLFGTKERPMARMMGSVGGLEMVPGTNEGWTSTLDWDGTPLPKGISRKESYR